MATLSTRELNLALVGEQIEINVHAEQGETVWVVFDDKQNTFRLGVFIGEFVHPDTNTRLTNPGHKMPAVGDVGFTTKGLAIRVVSIKH